jgi:xylan 1,4-beta-xylosidase
MGNLYEKPRSAAWHGSGRLRSERRTTAIVVANRRRELNRERYSGEQMPPKSHARLYSLALFSAFVLAILGCCDHPAQGQTSARVISIDAAAPARPFPHFWEHIFGSGRASLSLRESYRMDLRSMKRTTDIAYVRFHAILLDDVGVYDEDAQGHPLYNFSYVDQIYDGLLQSGVRPFVELSFMPSKLAAFKAIQAFWYRPNVAPPKSWDKWDDLVSAFIQHLINRYGIDEVEKWYFEVWNEPNIDFWAGEPKQLAYFDLYDHTAADIKRVSSRLRVGGPATAQAAWVDAFIRHCAGNHIPVDFVSTHVYGNDRAEDIFGTHEAIPREDMVCRAAKKVNDEVKASAFPGIPIIWSEFNASYKNEVAVTDAPYMGPWMANTIRECDGLVSEMSYWTFSDVFEEQGVVKQPFYGGYGLIAAGMIPKPSFNAFTLLHELGDQRISVEDDSTLATRREDGSLVLAAWNLLPPEQSGQPKTVSFQFLHLPAGKRAYISRVDAEHGDPLPAYAHMGSPLYPTPQQLVELRNAAVVPHPEELDLSKGILQLSIPAHGLALIEIR